MGTMIDVKINKRVSLYCDWCAKPQPRPLIQVALVTDRGVFIQDVCAECADEYAQRAV